MKKLNFIVLSIVISAVFLSACSQNNENSSENIEEMTNYIVSLEEKIEDLTEKISLFENEIEELKNSGEEIFNISNTNLVSSSISIVELLKDENLDDLSDWIHPTKGLRFSPYSYIDTNDSQVFDSQSIIGAYNDSSILLWGVYDGTGDPIELNFKDYYDRFIYDQDYILPHIISINNLVSSGSMFFNLDSIYPDASFVEFHFEGFDPEFVGMDWRSLILAFEEVDGGWYLVAIIHNEWTI